MDFIPKLWDFFAKGFDYIFTKWDRVADPFVEHLQMIGFSLLIALLIALPIGFLISRQKWRWLSTPVLGLLSILYTIPSLAFLAFLVPATGIGFTTTVIVLITYAQTMLVRNTALGFNNIEPSILESASAMGMTVWQRFYKIEIPLALPVIVAGIRIAALAIVSIATVGAFVGAGGLGSMVKPTNAPQRIAAGIILTVVIALTIDIGSRLLVRFLNGYRTPRVVAAVQATAERLKRA